MITDKARKVLNKIEKSEVFFIDNGFADINQCNSLGENALHLVTIWNDIEAASVLIESGIDIDKKGEHGYTPLHEAVQQEHQHMVELLLRNGASPIIKNNEGQNSIDLAKIHGYNKIINTLSDTIKQKSREK